MQTFCCKFVKYLLWVSVGKPLSPPPLLACFLNNDLTKTENRKLIITKWPAVKVMLNITRYIKGGKMFLNICKKKNISKIFIPSFNSLKKNTLWLSARKRILLFEIKSMESFPSLTFQQGFNRSNIYYLLLVFTNKRLKRFHVMLRLKGYIW